MNMKKGVKRSTKSLSSGKHVAYMLYNHHCEHYNLSSAWHDHDSILSIVNSSQVYFVGLVYKIKQSHKFICANNVTDSTVGQSSPNKLHAAKTKRCFNYTWFLC